MNHSVAIIGAGLSGLTAAYRLLQKDVDVHVYEARQRVGGRILTATLNGVNVELGGQNILDGGKAENILNLIADLQLATVKGRVRSRFHYHDGMKLIDMDEALSQWNEAHSQDQLTQRLKYLAENSQNMAQVLRSLFASHPKLYNLFAIRLMGYEGLPVEKLSSHYTKTLRDMLQKFNHSGKGEHRYFDYMTVHGGNAQLVEKIKEKLGNRITLGLPLKTLTKTPKNSYALNFDNGQTIEAERVILALPCCVYQDICFKGDDLLLSRLQDIKAVAYGEHAKLMVPIDMIYQRMFMDFMPMTVLQHFPWQRLIS